MVIKTVHSQAPILLCADAQDPFIELIRGPCCLATWVELLCLLLNHCEVLSFILYQKIERGEGKKDYRKQSEKENAQMVSSSCKLIHSIWINLGRGNIFQKYFWFHLRDWLTNESPESAFYLSSWQKRRSQNAIISLGTFICKVMRAGKIPHSFFFLDSCDKQCFFRKDNIILGLFWNPSSFFHNPPGTYKIGINWDF